MKTNRKTRASFSGNPPTINIKLPKSWEELSQDELRHVYKILSVLTAENKGDLPVILFRYFARCRVIRRDHSRFVCRFWAETEDGKVKPVRCRINPDQLAELLDPLDFINDPGTVPVRLDFWGGVKAVNAELHGVSFSTYLQVENLYQGFITSQNPEALRSMASLLYPGIAPKHIDEVFVLNLLQWIVQVKGLFARMWPNFFKPASSNSTDAPSMLEVMNNEIRALTGGDVTKEAEIYEIDCWRALTELDFKAKEAEEFNRMKNKK